MQEGEPCQNMRASASPRSSMRPGIPLLPLPTAGALSYHTSSQYIDVMLGRETGKWKRCEKLNMFGSENTENYPKGLFLILIQTKVKLDRNKSYYQYYLGTSDKH